MAAASPPRAALAEVQNNTVRAQPLLFHAHVLRCRIG
jgi:hypothetical protein